MPTSIDCNKANPLLRTGYQLEEQQSDPNTDRVAAFEEFMSQCGAPFAPPSSDTAGVRS